MYCVRGCDCILVYVVELWVRTDMGWLWVFLEDWAMLSLFLVVVMSSLELVVVVDKRYIFLWMG